jgi:conjugal transfer/entry exclusion protein
MVNSVVFRRLIYVQIFAFIALIAPGVAMARIVFDPSNYAKNTYTSIQQYLNTANSYISAIQDVRQTTRNIDSVVIGKLGLDTDELQLMRQFIRTGNNLKGAVYQVSQIQNDLNRSFVGGNKYLTWRDFIANIGHRRVQGDKSAKSLYEAANSGQESLRLAYEKHMRIVKEMPKIQGVTDAALTTSEMVGVLIEQNQAMLMMMSSGAQADGEKIQKEAIEREQKENAQQAYIESAQRLSERESEFFKQQVRK